MKFRLRIDEICPDMTERLSGFFAGTEHVLVKHVLPHGNPHYHIYYDNPMIMSVPALRYQIDKLTTCKGPQRSIKECDETRKDEYIQYLFNTKHGNISTTISSSIQLDDYIKKAKEVSEDFAKSRIKAKRPEVTLWEMAEEVRALCVTDNPTSEYELYRQYIEAAIDVCRKHKKTYTDFSIQRLVQTAITCNKDTRDTFVKNVMDRIFKT